MGGRGAEPVGRRGLAIGAGLDALQAAQLIGDGQERRRVGSGSGCVCGARATRDCDGPAVNVTAVTAAAVSAPATMRAAVVDGLQ